MSQIKTSFFIVITIALSLLITLGACEILLRFNDHLVFWHLDRPNRTVGLYEYDADLGWRNRPLYRQAYRVQDRRVIEEISSQGLRDREYTLKKPADVTRIAVLGCSFTFGHGIRAEETYAKELERLMNARGQRVEVMNFGVNGYGLDQMVLAYEKTVRAYQPDMVLVQFFSFNAFRALNQELWRTPKPRFVLESGELVLTNHPVPPRRFGPLQSWLLDKSRLYKLIYNSLLQIDAGQKAAQEKDVNANPAAHALSQALLRRLQKDAAADHARLIVMTRNPEYAWIKKMTAADQLEVFSLLDQEDPKPWEQKGNLFTPDMHWSALGSEYVATAINNYLNRGSSL